MLFTNFASGELSRTLFGRTDIQQYFQGASKLQNFDVIPTGGIRRRSGTKFVAQLPAACRLIPFGVNSSLSWMFVIGSGFCNIYRNETLFKLASTGAPADFGSFFVDAETGAHLSLAEIRGMQYAQAYNKIIFVHRRMKPVCVEFTGDNSLTCSQMSFTFVPTYSVTDIYGVLDTSTFKFKSGAGNDGTDSALDDITADTTTFRTTGNLPGCITFWQGRMWLASTENNPQGVWASSAELRYDAETGKYADNYSSFSPETVYITVSKQYKTQDLHVFTADVTVSKTVYSDNGDSATIENGTSTTTSETVTPANGGYILTGLSQDMSASLLSGKTLSDYYITGDNIPVGTKAVEFHTVTEAEKAGTDVSYLAGKFKEVFAMDSIKAGDLCLVMDHAAGATVSRGEMSMQLWKDAGNASADDLEYTMAVDEQTGASSAISFQPASDRNDPVQWMCGKTALIIGCESTEFVLDAGATAVSLSLHANSRHGSGDLQATMVGGAVIFFQEGCRSVQEYYYNSDEEAFRANNIAMLSPEMLSESSVLDFDYTNCPYSRIIATRTDGSAAVMLYEKENGVMAWSRTALGSGSIRSCAVVNDGSGNDLVYFAVDDGAGHTYLEKLDPDGTVYLDRWSVYDAAATSAYAAGNAVLFNATQGTQCLLSALAEGFIAPGDTVYIGYAYASVMASMPVVTNEANAKKRISMLDIRLIDSYAPTLYAAADGGTPEVVPLEQVPYSGVYQSAFPGNSACDAFFRIEMIEPRPLTVLAVNAELSE